MVSVKYTDISGFFKDTQESFLWSCKQGIMGNFYARERNFKSLMAVLGDFTFFDGEPDRALVEYLPKESKPEFRILVPPDEAWGRLIEDCYRGRSRKIMRYRMKKEPNTFDTDSLKRAARLPKGYTFKWIEEEFYNRCREEEWSRDFTAQFADYESFSTFGMGVLALKGEELVSGASSYSAWKGGIEIEVDTKEEYRRQGLASACCARLILACLETGRYPSWDAHTENSLALSEKLGYHLDCPYIGYEIYGERSKI